MSRFLSKFGSNRDRVEIPWETIPRNVYGITVRVKIYSASDTSPLVSRNAKFSFGEVCAIRFDRNRFTVKIKERNRSIEAGYTDSNLYGEWVDRSRDFVFERNAKGKRATGTRDEFSVLLPRKGNKMAEVKAIGVATEFPSLQKEKRFRDFDRFRKVLPVPTGILSSNSLFAWTKHRKNRRSLAPPLVYLFAAYKANLSNRFESTAPRTLEDAQRRRT